MSNLSGKVAVVTGGSQGVGAGIARALAAEGAAVVIGYNNSEVAARAVVTEIERAGGRASAVKADVTREDDAQSLINAADESFGRLDILVNNAGIYEFAPIEAVSVESYRKVFDTNVLGVLLPTRAAASVLRPGGSIINIGSNITELSFPASSVYSGSKAAIESITKVLSRELGPRKVRVNCVLPGPVDTETSRNMTGISPEQIQMIIGMTPLGRIGTPADIGSVVSLLASDAAGWITGAIVLTSGGLQ